MNQQNKPIDKGRVCVIAEKYPSGQFDGNNQPILKNRYATVGRATLWPNKEGSNMPNVEIEIDTLPVGHTGKLKFHIFWEMDNQQQQQPQQQQGYAHQPQQEYQQRQ